MVGAGAGAKAHSRFAPVPGAFSNLQSEGDGGELHFWDKSLNPTQRAVAISR